jgi:large subunit ribosomal protein L10
MSKYVKDLVTRDIAQRLEGVEDAVLVNVVGLDANSTVALRKRLREKNIRLLVIKNSLAKRATEGSTLGTAFNGSEGPLAVCWGAEDFVSLVKEITELDKGTEFEKFEARGGVMDGEHLTAERVREISKWPNRFEQLAILAGQILSPGAELGGAMLGPGAQVASQIEKKAEEKENEG